MAFYLIKKRDNEAEKTGKKRKNKLYKISSLYPIRKRKNVSTGTMEISAQKKD